MPNVAVLGRTAICDRCPTPCGARPDLTKAKASCPLPVPRWGPWKVGLGTVVATAASPIAAAIDATTGLVGRLLGKPQMATKLKRCGGCAKREAKLNRVKLG